MSNFLNGNPKITKVKFPHGKIILYLSDARIITMPINCFPEIKKLSFKQRRKHNKLAGFGLMFDDIDEVYHISDFLGLHNTVAL